MVSDETTAILVRVVHAPLESVFAAWIDSDLIQLWLAPAGSAVRAAETAPRRGGRYRIEVIDSDWNHHLTTGIYEELIPNRVIVKSWLYIGPNARPDESVTRLDVRFRAIDTGGTEVALRHELLVDAEHRDRMQVAWAQCLDKLEAMLTGTRDGSNA